MVLRAVSSLLTYPTTATHPPSVERISGATTSTPRTTPHHVDGEAVSRVRRGAGVQDGCARRKHQHGTLAWPTVQPGWTWSAGPSAATGHHRGRGDR